MIYDFLENSAIRYPDKIAVVCNSERATYRQINSHADNLACRLQEIGIRKSDRVALLMENSIDYVVAYYGILKAGCVVAPLNPGLKPEGLQNLLEDLEPAAIIAGFKSERLLNAVSLDPKYLKLLIIKTPKKRWHTAPVRFFTFEDCISEQETPIGNPNPKPNPNDPAGIIYTSGSSGKPKGVVLSHGNIVSNTLSICRYLSLTQDDIQMVVLPFFYVMGKSLLNTHFAVGGTVVINNTFSYPATVIKQMVEEKVTGFSGVPSTYAHLLHRSPLARHRDELQSLRYCSQAGGHMAAQLKKDLRHCLPDHTRIVIMYGATEASARLSYLEPEQFERKMGSIGKAIPGVELKIVNEAGSTVENGLSGELLARGPNIMQGYWNDIESTRKAIDTDGYYHTGDIAYEDADGYLYITGRKDNVLKISGHKVNPQEIEECLMQTQQLVETAVIGVADQLKGYRLVALCVPKNDIREAELQSHCHKFLSNHQIPGEFLFLKTLPRGSSGKVDNQECVRVYHAGIRAKDSAPVAEN